MTTFRLTNSQSATSNSLLYR